MRLHFNPKIYFEKVWHKMKAKGIECGQDFLIKLFQLGVIKKKVQAKPVNVIFRYDDYSAMSHTDLEIRIINLFRKNKISLTFSVIPYIINGDVHDCSLKEVVPIAGKKAELLRNAAEDGIVDPALHGFSHQRRAIDDLTEFSCCDYENQYIKILKGKTLLEDIFPSTIKTFVPPWNTYDHNTLRVLEELGFQIISADRIGESNIRSKLKFLPATCSIKRMELIIQRAKYFSGNPNLIVALFHDYDFQEVNPKSAIIDFQSFSRLVDSLRKDSMVRILSMNHAADIE